MTTVFISMHVGTNWTETAVSTLNEQSLFLWVVQSRHKKPERSKPNLKKLRSLSKMTCIDVEGAHSLRDNDNKSETCLEKHFKFPHKKKELEMRRQ